MPGRNRNRRQASPALALAFLSAFTASTLSAERDRTVQTILSNLPQRSSPAYEELLKVLGRPNGEQLEMTKSEIWNVPAVNWKRFERAAGKLGVKVIKLDASWNHALMPMTAGHTMTQSQSEMMHDAMSSKAAMGMSMMALPDAAVEEFALTKGMHEGLSPEAQPELVIALTGTLSVKARRSAIVKTAGGYAWHGVVEETGEPVTLLWWPTGRLTGKASYHGQIYSIRSLGGGMQGIVEMNPNALPDEHAPMSPELKRDMNMQTDPLVSKGDASMVMPVAPPGDPTLGGPVVPKRHDMRNLEDAAPANVALNIPRAIDIAPSPRVRPEKPVTIRVLVAYTAGAARHYDDIETDLIPLAIEDANQSFRTSGIGNVQIELAYAYQTPYVESGTHFEHVFRFAGANDGYMDEVHALRDSYAADIGVLIVDDANGCGLAAEVYARPERAFAVVHHECAANMYSLAHEIGHLIGARHDEALDDTAMPFAFGHGYVHGNDWRTMMSYKDSCGGCMRLPIWSNPEVLVHGQPAGDEKSNNARVIAEQAARVAGFR